MSEPMTDELRDKIAAEVTSAACDMRSVDNPWEVARIILAIPEVAVALRQSKMIADEPEAMIHGYIDASPRGILHDNIFARLRKAGEQ